MVPTPIEFLSSIDVFGFYVPPLFFWVAAALLPFALIKWALTRARLYRYIWHCALFDVSMYVILLGGMVLAGGGVWL